jgi:plasmid stabilization system protein ParE
MTRRISLSVEARRDIHTVIDYYDLEGEGLGDKFLGELAAILDTVVERPKSFPEIYRNIRRAQLDRFRYGVFFRLTDSERSIRVIAVVHLHRDPRTWQRRAKRR